MTTSHFDGGGFFLTAPGRCIPDRRATRAILKPHEKFPGAGLLRLLANFEHEFLSLIYYEYMLGLTGLVRVMWGTS